MAEKPDQRNAPWRYLAGPHVALRKNFISNEYNLHLQDATEPEHGIAVRNTAFRGNGQIALPAGDSEFRLAPTRSRLERN